LDSVRASHISPALTKCVALQNYLYVIEGRFIKTGAKMAKIVRRTWSKEDVRTLKTMAKSKSGANKISKALKRTIGATMVKASKLGVSLDTRG
jgi:hypothetical protein